MLTEEGKKVARDCLLRSGLVDPCGNTETLKEFSFKDPGQTLDSVSSKEEVSVIGSQPETAKVAALTPSHLTSMEKRNDISPEYLDRVCFSYLAYLKHLVLEIQGFLFCVNNIHLLPYAYVIVLNYLVIHKSKFLSQ